MPDALTLEALYAPVEPALQRVRERVLGLWAEALELVDRDSVPEPSTGGKMLRPSLCLLSAGAVGARDLARYAPMAAAFELLHLAALAHDDVLDGSDMRRGQRSLKARWNNHSAVLGGDYLVARAIELLGEHDDCRVIVNAIGSVREMAEGELVDYGRGPAYFTEDGCISWARQKTASLFAVSCSTPSILVDERHRAALHAFGVDFGIAFQIIDDLLDLLQDESTLGKPACLDIAEGKKTLPLLYLRDALSPEDAGRLDALRGDAITDADRDWVQDALEETGALERTQRIARNYALRARKHLDDLPPSVFRDSMAGLVDFILVRGY